MQPQSHVGLVVCKFIYAPQAALVFGACDPIFHGIGHKGISESAPDGAWPPLQKPRFHVVRVSPHFHPV